jgi:hypothetical protein
MAERYMALNGKYLEDADKLLAEGDYVQASEKYWGAMAEMVKAIAAVRGWRHHTHRELVQAVERLLGESGLSDLRTLFSVGEALHSNFYENWMGQDQIVSAAATARTFVERLEPLVAR